MTRLLLLRHPRVALPAGICYGASDVPAARWPAPNLAALRACIPADTRVLSSPLSRCRVIAESLGAPVRLDARLQEIHFGDWELQHFDALDRALIDAWAAAPWTFVPPRGESAEAMSVRVLAALHEALREMPRQLLVVTHGGPLRVIIGSLLKLPREQWLALSCEPGSLTVLRVEGDAAEIEFPHALPPYETPSR